MPCESSLEGQNVCMVSTFNNKKTAVLSTCNNGVLELDVSSALSFYKCKGKICSSDYSKCIDNPNGNPFDSLAGECTDKSQKTCIEVNGKAYIGTCNGSNYTYNDSTACISKKCNKDKSNCDYEETCSEEEQKTNATICYYGLDPQHRMTAYIQLPCMRADDGNYKYSYQGSQTCQNGCSDDGLKCK